MDTNQHEEGRPYELAETVDRKSVTPSVAEVVRVCLENGRDAVTLVRPAQGDLQPAFVLAMIGVAPMRRMGDVLLRFATQAAAGRPEPERRLIIQPDTHLKWIFTWMEESKQRWSWAKFTVDGEVITLVSFLGEETCKPVAEYLTRNGVPTALK
jgi:hypothetical protein